MEVMWLREKTRRRRRRREKEDASGLGCTIVDDLLSKERVKLFFQNHWRPGDAISRLALFAN